MKRRPCSQLPREVTPPNQQGEELFGAPQLSEVERRRALRELLVSDRSRFGDRQRNTKLTLRIGCLLQERLGQMRKQHRIDQTLLVEIALDRLLSSLGF